MPASWLNCCPNRVVAAFAIAQNTADNVQSDGGNLYRQKAGSMVMSALLANVYSKQQMLPCCSGGHTLHGSLLYK